MATTPTIKQLLVTVEKQFKEIISKLDKLVTPTPTPVPPTPTPTPIPTPTPVVSELYIGENQASLWVKNNPNHPDVAQVKKISTQPIGQWLGGWSGNVFDAVKSTLDKAAGKLVIFVAYNIPGRDNGNYSAGGLGSAAEYHSWIGAIGSAIGDKRAYVILEPDAIALSTEIDATKKAERLEMIRVAVDILKKQPNVKVYLDASMWKTPAEMASLLNTAGMAKADGFSCNVSGFKKTSECETWAKQLQGIVNKPYLIDTSRNGNGEWQTTEINPWCNPPGRALGDRPDLAKGYVWLKLAGESDGTCRGFPSAGTFVPEKAIEMAKNAAY